MPTFSVTSFGDTRLNTGRVHGPKGKIRGLTLRDVCSQVAYAIERGDWLLILDEAGNAIPMDHFPAIKAPVTP